MIKAPMNVGIEEMYLNIIKAICDKPIASIILNGEKLKPFLPNQEQDKSVHSIHSYQQSLRISSQNNKTGRSNKRNTNR
jgi:hypothetical protein